MIWPDDVSFEGYTKKKANFRKENYFLGDPPIKAQYALDLIFKTLVDDKEKFSYLTTIPESTEQVNSIMLEIILTKYSKEYRKFLRGLRK